MCDVCGCEPQAGVRVHHVAIGESLRQQSDVMAKHNRDMLAGWQVLVVHLMSSPGAGKTALLEATARWGKESMAVIEGDLATERDAQRLKALDIRVLQLTTGSACHLDAQMVHEAVHLLDLTGVRYLFIEDVGNLVCPATFDLGQHVNVVLLSPPEGDDKPAKYPPMFRAADLVIFTKSDLLPFIPEFDRDRALSTLYEVVGERPVVHLSAKNGLGMAAWFAWLEQQYQHVFATV